MGYIQHVQKRLDIKQSQIHYYQKAEVKNLYRVLHLHLLQMKYPGLSILPNIMATT